MDRKRELKQQYKETKIEAGIYQIKNTQNGKVFIGSTPNLKTLNGVRFMLEMGSHKNKKLQLEWKEYGEEAFTVDVLEILQKDKDKLYYNEKEELEKLEEKWLEELQPFVENGYHTMKK